MEIIIRCEFGIHVSVAGKAKRCEVCSMWDHCPIAKNPLDLDTNSIPDKLHFDEI